MVKGKQLASVMLAIIIALSGFVSVYADDAWKSKYRDVIALEGTEYFLIHLYDVKDADGNTFYATGVADKDGNVVLPIKYMGVDTLNYSEGRRMIYAPGGKTGFVDDNFKVIIEPVYDQAWAFENGVARVQKKNADGTAKLLYIDINGNETAEPDITKDFDYYEEKLSLEQNLYIYDRIGSSDNVICLKDAEYGIVNVKTGKYLSPLKWDYILLDKSGAAWGQLKDGEAYGTYTIDDKGTETFKFKSERIESFNDDGLIFISKFEPVKEKPYDNPGGELTDSTVRRLGLMDSNGRVLVEPIWEVATSGWSDSMPEYKDGYLIGQQNSENYEYIKGIGTMGDGKFGVVNKSGIVVIEPIYDSIDYEGNNKFHVIAGTEERTIDLSSGAAETTPSAPKVTARAQAASSEIYVNGKKTDFEAYLIDGYNYFKLRDIAYSLNGTQKQFEVKFDSEKNAITLLSGESYTASGEEMKTGGGGIKDATLTQSEIYLDGKKVSMTAYNIDGFNFFKLRDFGSMLNFATDYDGGLKSVSIDTAKEYKE